LPEAIIQLAGMQDQLRKNKYQDTLFEQHPPPRMETPKNLETINPKSAFLIHNSFTPFSALLFHFRIGDDKIE